MPLLLRLSIAWITGIALARWLDLPWPVVALAGLPAIGGLFLYRHNPRARAWAVLGLALAAGAFRFAFFQPVIDQSHIAFYNDGPEPITVTGLVVMEPDIRDTYTNLHVRVESLQQDNQSQAVAGLLLVRASRYPERFYGDRLTITGRLETPPIFDEFNYREYLARFGIHAMIRRPQIELVETGQGCPFWTVLYSFKAHASATINRLLAEPYASLLNGILLGIETGIPEALYDEFNLTGTSHIIVISGSNIALIAGVLLLAGRWLVGQRHAPLLAIVGIMIYTFLVGADAAVSRAAVMGIVWMLALLAGRPGQAINSLFFSAMILTLINPLMLSDVGFQLSFVATLGLIVLIPPLEQTTFNLVQRFLKTNQVNLAMALLSELLIITLAAQIITGPLLMYHFGRLSLVSLLSNLLILPVQPLIMGAGSLAALTGMLWLPLGQVVAWLAWLPLAWTVWVVQLTARLPYASLDLGIFPFWLLVLMYAVLAAGVWSANRPAAEKPERPHFRLPEIGSITTRLWLGGAGIILLLIWLAILALPDGRLHVAFLDVGQGDAILITTPDGQQILIDGGPSASQLNWQLGQEMPFWDHSLEMVINTHPDMDHLAGLVSLLERYQIKQTIVTDVAGRGELYQAWERELAEKQLTPIVGQAGMQLALSRDLTATILSPGLATTAGLDEPNNRSLVLHLQFGRISFLLPGDIEEVVERRLVLNQAPLSAVVLKSPHHGSQSSSSEIFLKAVDPQIVVISVGQENRFGHPSPKVLERYTQHGLTLLRTDKQGTIEFITDGENLWVETTR